MKPYNLKLTALLFLLTTPFNIYADSLPSGISITLGNMGSIDRINVAKGEIVINDMHMLLSSTIKIHSPTKKISTRRELQQGMKINFKSAIVGQKIMVTEMWVLPNN